MDFLGLGCVTPIIGVGLICGFALYGFGEVVLDLYSHIINSFESVESQVPKVLSVSWVQIVNEFLDQLCFGRPID